MPIRRGCILGLFLILTTSCFADVSPTDQQRAIQQQDRTLLEEQRRLDEQRQQQLRKSQETPKEIRVLPHQESRVIEGPLSTFQINEIHISGNTRFHASIVERFTRNYENKQLTQNDITALLRDLTNLYLEHGYITSRASLPTQNLRSGTLAVHIQEGSITALQFSDSPTKNQQKLWSAFSTGVGQVLNVFDLDQGLENLHRIQGIQCTFQLVPDLHVIGGTQVIIEKKGEPSGIRSRALYDNIESISWFPRQFILSKDDLFQLNDTWQTSLSQVTGKKDAQQKSLSVNGSLPLGHNTLSLALSDIQYSSVIAGETLNFLSSGQTQSVVFQWDKIFYRDQRTKLLLHTELALKDTVSYIDTVKSEVGSRKLRILGIGLSADLGAFTFSTTYFKGLKGLDAKKDPSDIQAGEPRAQFEKWVADTSVFYPLSNGSLPMSYRLTGHGQWSGHTLYGSERASVGDEYTVRGFRGEAQDGDRGGYIRQDVSVGLLGVQWLAGVDVGRVSFADDDRDITLVGSALGVSGVIGTANWDLTLGIPIHATDRLQHSGAEWYLRTSIGL